MPELPEVETVRRGLEPVLTGARVARVDLRRANLRFPFPERFAERVCGRAVLGLGRRAKYLLADLDSGETLIMHLGMSGRFVIELPDGRAAEPGEFHTPIARHLQHDHVLFEIEGGARILYNDVRRFGFMDLVPTPDLATCVHFRRMGIEPLGNELSGELLAKLFRAKSAPLKAALLDQRLIAGLGNIYVCEALFRAGLDPQAQAGSIATASGKPHDSAYRLARIIRDVLSEAVVAGGSTLRDFAHTDGSLGYFQHRFQVYDRTGQVCVTPACEAVVERVVQAGRSTFFCPVCQAGGRKPRPPSPM
jgi:formamidopyrimidine-DNA glycosylase